MQRGQLPGYVSHPGIYQASSVINRTFRFLGTSSSTQYTVTVNDILDLYFFATSATTGIRMANAIKIKKVEAWVPANAPAAATFSNANQVSLQWLTDQAGVQGAPSKVIQDVALGATDIAHIVARPPRGSLAAQWISSAPSDADRLFTIAMGGGGVFDITVAIVLPEGGGGAGEGNVAVVRTIAGATLGNLYVSGIPSTAPTLIPCQCLTI